MKHKKKTMNFIDLIELGRNIENQLKIYDNEENNEFIIYVDSEFFKKIDEDIYYRQFPDGEDFTPSDNTIIVNLEHLVIRIKKKEE